MLMIGVERGELGRKVGGVSLLIVVQSRLCIFEILLWDPGVFFSRISFSLDQEGLSG